MLRIFRCSILRVKTQQNFWTHNSEKHCTIIRNNVTDDTHSYLHEHEVRILNVINDNNVSELSKYDITLGRVKKLILNRSKNGPYKSLQDLALINEIDPKTLRKFYTSILEGRKKEKKNENDNLVQKLKCSIIPAVPEDIQNETSTTLGIQVGCNIVSWALLNHSNEVLEWECEKMKNSPSLNSIYNPVQQVLEIVKKLPVSDIYVMEEGKLPKSKENKKNINAFYQQQQLTIAIMVCLAARNSESLSLENRLFTLRHQVSARFFGLIVGSEIISSQYIMPQLLGGTNEISDKNVSLPPVYIGEKFKEEYQEKQALEQEQMNWSLLKALTFIELGIHRKDDKN